MRLTNPKEKKFKETNYKRKERGEETRIDEVSQKSGPNYELIEFFLGIRSYKYTYRKCSNKRPASNKRVPSNKRPSRGSKYLISAPFPISAPHPHPRKYEYYGTQCRTIYVYGTLKEYEIVQMFFKVF